VADRSIDEVVEVLGLTERPAILAKLGVPSKAEIEALLEPHGQTVRGTGVGGSAGG
jgi:fumarate hydratase class II